jgi:hypothetical protein
MRAPPPLRLPLPEEPGKYPKNRPLPLEIPWMAEPETSRFPLPV